MAVKGDFGSESMEDGHFLLGTLGDEHWYWHEHGTGGYENMEDDCCLAQIGDYLASNRRRECYS